MKKMLFLVLLIVLLATLNATWEAVNQSVNNELIDYQQISASEINLSFHLDDYTVTDELELPVFSYVIAVPAVGKISHSSQYSEEIVKLGEPAIMRDYRLVPVIFSPLQLDTETGRINQYTEINIKISVSDSGGRNCQSRSRLLSRSFEPLYEAGILNYREMRQRDDYQQPSMIIVCPDSAEVIENLADLVNWKRQKGFKVTLITTAETGTTAEDIKDYIQEAYDNWDNPPEYICLAGDTDGAYPVATWFHNSHVDEAGDHPYGLLAGDDILLDAHVGRLSYDTITQLQILVNKILYYEQSPMMENTDWYERSLLVGDPSNSGSSTINTMRAIKEMMLEYPGNWNDNDDFYEVYNGSFTNQMNTAINEGCLYMFYRGAAGCSGWYPGSTNNNFMLPFASLITCGTGNFYNHNSDTELFTRMGTATTPIGAIGAVGQADTGTHTCFNNALTLGMSSGLLSHNVFSMGGVLTMGKFCLWSLYPQNPANMVGLHSHVTSLVGDPSLELWTGVPGTLEVEHQSFIAEGESLFQVIVHDQNGAYAEGACVTLSFTDPLNFAVTRYCDNYGEVLLPIPGIVEEYTLTVTLHDHLPYTATITSGQAEQYVNVREIYYQEISGNGDGLLNPGESFDLDVSLFNFGTLPVEGVTAWLSTESEYVTVSSSEITAGDIGAWEAIEPTESFGIEISETALGGIEPLLEFRITDSTGQEWTCWKTLYITGANLWLSATQTGNDNFLHSGEIDAVFIELTNNGAVGVEDVSVQLSSVGNYLTLLDSISFFSSIPAGESVYNFNDGFSVQTRDEIYPGSLINLRLEISNGNGYEAIIPYSVPVGGAQVTDPYGPDAYGYWCFDDGDLEYEYCPEFDWLEIDPDYGGSGEDLPLYSPGNQAMVQVFDLPVDFNLNFYGESYREITVCTSGWIAPGEHPVPSFMNWYIPSPQGPSPMIAVFWDDLATAGGDICWQYFEAEHYLVIEWSQMLNGDTGSPETFEVILYDADFYPTITGASQIKMQYLTVYNNNAGSYRADHGQYCTIGLENNDSSTGLQYTFNNCYADANKVLEDDTALLFTPTDYGQAAWLNISDIALISGNDEYIEAGETASLNLSLHNRGDIAANDINIMISTEDVYITILENTATLSELLPGDAVYLDNEFSFLVSEEIPDYHDFIIVAAIECEQGWWEREIRLTGYQPNTFSLDIDEISLEMEIDQTDSRTFELTNVGEEAVNFYLRAYEIEVPEREISGSTVRCDSVSFVPGQISDWILEICNNSSDNEWLTNLSLEFPLNVSLNYATDVTGGSSGDLVWDGNTGSGIVEWSGTTANGWGVIHDGETAYVTLNVSISDEFAGDLYLPWVLTGDGYGEAPHTEEGEIILFYPISWMDSDISAGILAAGETCPITLDFNTAELEYGWYNAIIEITTDSWDNKQVNVSLHMLSNEGEEIFLPDADLLLGNYPNPFNPSTKISFLLAESKKAELTIYNIKGQTVRKLIDEPLEAGKHEIFWDGCNEQGDALSSGIFLYQLKTTSETYNSKMILLK